METGALATTAGELRKLLVDLPDTTPLTPVWRNGPPCDDDPAVVVYGLQVVGDQLQVLVDIKYLDEFDGPEDEDDDTDDDDDGGGLLGPRKPGVPSQSEMYQLLKERSEQLQREAALE